MSIISNKKIFYINSRYRLDGTDSQFSYEIDLPEDNKYNKVCILEASIPKSYYLVEELRNTFDILENDIFLETIEVPPGNYTRRSFQSVLDGLLPAGYLVSYPDTSTSADTGKFSFVSIHADSSFEFGNNHIPEIMGFDRSSSNYFNAGFLESVNVLNFQRETTLFIHSNAVAGHTNNVLLDIFSNANPDFSTIVWRVSDIEAHSKPLSTNTSKIFDFKLLNDDQQSIDLNGQSLLITLMVYESHTVYDVLRDSIQRRILRELINRKR